MLFKALYEMDYTIGQYYTSVTNYSVRHLWNVKILFFNPTNLNCSKMLCEFLLANSKMHEIYPLHQNIHFNHSIYAIILCPFHSEMSRRMANKQSDRFRVQKKLYCAHTCEWQHIFIWTGYRRCDTMCCKKIVRNSKLVLFIDYELEKIRKTMLQRTSI